MREYIQRLTRELRGEETDPRKIQQERQRIERLLRDSEAVRSLELAQQVPDARRPEDRFGSIEAPRHPLVAKGAEFAQDVGRRVEGSSGEFFLPGEGVGNWLNKLAYGEEPGAMDRIGAGADLADIVPGVGTALGAAALIPKRAADAAQAASRAGMGVGKSKRRVGTTGKYVGAPAGVDSPQALAQMRKSYMEQMEAGIPGREWYHEASKWVDETAPDGRRQAVADTLGVTSQGTGVDTNLGFTVSAMNQHAAGQPVKTGRFPGNQSPLIEQSMVGDRTKLGPKRQPFADNLSVDWNPDKAQHPVHDIWQGRAFGYTHPDGKPWDAGFSPQQHAFMDEESALIMDRANKARMGGFDDWDPLRGQAAAWTGAKIRAGDLDPSDAAKHYGDFSGKYQAFGTHEQIPGANSGHAEELLGEPYDVRAQYSQQAGWQDSRGRDSIYSSGGMITEPTTQGTGAYTPQSTGLLEVNPMEVARPLVTTAEGAVRPGERALLDAGESARAYTDVQNAGAWHKVIPDSQTKMGDRTSLVINMGSPSEAQMRQLDALAKENGMFVIDTGTGVRLMNDPWSDAGAARTGTTLGKDLKGDLGRRLNEITGGAKVERAKIEGGYEDYESLWQAGPGSGRATEKFLEDLDRVPEFSSRIEPALRRKAAANLQRDQALAAERGFQVREDIQNARRILSEGGLEALKKAVKAGAILPAVAAAVLAPGEQEPSDQPPSGLLM